MDAATLLNGPRGRGLCMQVVRDQVGGAGQERLVEELNKAAFRLDSAMDPDHSSSVTIFGFAEEDGHPLTERELNKLQKQAEQERARERRDPSGLLESLARCIEEIELVAPDRDRLVSLLADEVAQARYWQHPNGIDFAAATPGVSSALQRVAELVAPLCDWMQAPVDREQSWILSSFEREPKPLTGVLKTMRENRAEIVNAASDKARARAAHRSPDREPSGAWWTWIGFPPRSTGLTPSAELHGPLGLYCGEDDIGEDVRHARRLVVTAQDRVLEIRGRNDWVDLCATYPLDATLSRRGNWWMATGRDGLHPQDGTDPGWVIPDLAAAAQDWDGIHLTVAAYLELSGTVIPVEPQDGERGGALGASMIAGWSPDETYWLSDRTAAETRTWVRDEEDEAGTYRLKDG